MPARVLFIASVSALEDSARWRHVGQCESGELWAYLPWRLQAQIALNCTV